jgi:O-antigen ligase
MKWTTRHFLRRRRWDAWLTGLGGAAMPLRHGLTPFVTVFFAAVGIYLVAVGHRGARGLAPWFTGLAVAYLAWSLVLVVAHGDPVLSNQQMTYSLLIGSLGFIANGLVLVRDPLRYFVVGSRVGVVAATFAAMSFHLIGESRVGLGGNPAPFAMVAAICMIAAVLPVRNAPRWAPNSIVYALIGAVPIFFSETRALLVIVPLVLVVEYVVWLRTKSRGSQIAGAVAGVVLSAGLLAAGPVHDLIDRVITPVVLHYTGHDVEWDSATGDIRLALWQGAAVSIAERPLVGFGEDRMTDVVLNAPAMHEVLAEFKHVHNMFLDEALLHGLPGLFILSGLLVVGLGYVYRYARDTAVKRNAFYFLAALLSYGSLHNPFLHETTICGIFLYLGVMIAAAARNRLRPQERLKASAGR